VPGQGKTWEELVADVSHRKGDATHPALRPRSSISGPQSSSPTKTEYPTAEAGETGGSQSTSPRRPESRSEKARKTGGSQSSSPRETGSPCAKARKTGGIEKVQAQSSFPTHDFPCKKTEGEEVFACATAPLGNVRPQSSEDPTAKANENVGEQLLNSSVQPKSFLPKKRPVSVICIDDSDSET